MNDSSSTLFDGCQRTTIDNEWICFRGDWTYFREPIPESFEDLGDGPKDEKEGIYLSSGADSIVSYMARLDLGKTEFFYNGYWNGMSYLEFPKYKRYFSQSPNQLDPTSL